MKKLCVWIILLLFGLLMITACRPFDEPEHDRLSSESTAVSETESSTDTETETDTEIQVDTDPDDETVVITTEDTGRVIVAWGTNITSYNIYRSLQPFLTAIQEKTGLKMQFLYRREGEEAFGDAKGFLVGRLPYEETKAVMAELPANSYAVTVRGGRIVIVGSDDNLTVLAMAAFCERILTSPACVGKGMLTMSAEDGFVVTLDHAMTLTEMIESGLTVNAAYEMQFNAPAQGEYRVAQGAASDGTYVYMALRNSDDSGSVIVKYRLDDGRQVAVSKVLDLGHANDMTYDTDRGILVVAHGKREGKILTLVDPENLTWIEDVAIERGAGAITYDPLSGQYIISQGGKNIHLLDGNWNYIKTFERAKVSGYTAQGMGSDGRYLFFPMSASVSNILDTFDMDGNRVAEILIPFAHESESMFYVNGRYYVACNQNGATLYEIFFRVSLT